MMRWKYISHCQTGTSHLKDNQGCQDSVSVRENGDYLAAALADGLGFYSGSAVAAKAATEAAVSWLLDRSDRLFAGENIENLLTQNMLRDIKAEVLRAAREYRTDENNLDCNLAFVCIMQTTGKAIVGQLGDCALCLIGKQSRVLTDLSGSYGTSTVLDPHASDRMTVKLVDLNRLNIDAMILTSDGLEKEIYRKGSHVIRKTAQFYVNLPVQQGNAEQLLQERLSTLVRNHANVFDDDISMVILSRATGPMELPEDPTWLCTCGQRNNIISDRCMGCGQEFINVYPRLDISGHSCVDGFFRHLNLNPEQERRILQNRGGQPPADPPAPEVREESPFRELMTEDITATVTVSQGDLVTTEMLEKQWSEPSSQPKEQPRTSPRTTAPAPKRSAEPKAAQRPSAPRRETKPKVSATRKPLAAGRSADAIRRSSALFAVPEPLKQMPDDRQREPDATPTDIPGTAEGQPDAGRVQSEHPSVPKAASVPDVRRSSSPAAGLLTVILGGAVLVLLVLLALMFLRGKGASQGTSWYAVSDGVYYSGEMEDGKPNGSGILQEDRYYWIGTFRDGKKHGRFLVVKCDDPEDGRYVEFENGEQVGTQLPEADTSLQSSTVKAKSVRLRKEPGYDGSSTSVKIQQGETVYLTNREPVTQDDVLWVEVQTADGAVGWCESGALLMEEE